MYVSNPLDTSRLLARNDDTQKPSDAARDAATAHLAVNQHWLKLIHYSLTDLRSNPHLVDLQELQAVFFRFPTVHVGLNDAIQLPLRGESQEAQHWLRQTCSVQSPRHCDYLKTQWIASLNTNASWPTTVFDSAAQMSPR